MKAPFRSDHVGSLLRPKALQAARAQYAAGSIDAAALAEIEDAQIRTIVRRQEAIGLQGVTDGELRRSWWHLDFLWAFDGIERIDIASGVAFAGASTRRQGLGVVAPIRCSGHPMVEHFRFLQALTSHTPKVTIPAPSALYGRPILPPIDHRVYPHTDALFDDLAEAYRQIVGEFAAAGCRYLQLDEVFIAMLCDAGYRQQMLERGDDPDALLKLYARSINTAIADVPDDMSVTLHLCRGNYRSTYMGAGGYEAVDQVLFNEINVDAYFLEYDNERSGGFEPLRFLPKGKKAALGLVTTKVGALERADDLRRRIDEAARYADIDALCLSTQCGFASTEEGNQLTEDEQWAKLERIVEVAESVWG
ncbi:MAG TPA: 5-methyltetrahydropteroyltriglutamate--homocysteine S-methyltransferase [Gammaproteobacteria bacterium]|nr:5-methyltetrahydropteroyltriglutamate--homocysteine S-methyltransferase [Gammaproteobacteria bacterium]